jgi:hypothetical protein
VHGAHCAPRTVSFLQTRICKTMTGLTVDDVRNVARQQAMRGESNPRDLRSRSRESARTWSAREKSVE